MGGGNFIAVAVAGARGCNDCMRISHHAMVSTLGIRPHVWLVGGRPLGVFDDQDLDLTLDGFQPESHLFLKSGEQ